MEKTTVKALRPLDFAWLFGVPTILNGIACKIAIPVANARGLFPAEVNYFICVGVLVLAPMFFAALYLCGREIGSFEVRALLARMRVKKLTGPDWMWTVAMFVALSAASFLIARFLMPRFGLEATPFFFENMPLPPEQHWIIAVWPIFFFFNIFGEEFFWRGYIQTRQELLTGNWTWLVHGLLWAVWHVPMGLDLIVASLPIFFVLPAVVQLRRNTSIAIIIHAVFGAFGFLALALGALH